METWPGLDKSQKHLLLLLSPLRGGRPASVSRASLNTACDRRGKRQLSTPPSPPSTASSASIALGFFVASSIDSSIHSSRHLFSRRVLFRSLPALLGGASAQLALPLSPEITRAPKFNFKKEQRCKLFLGLGLHLPHTLGGGGSLEEGGGMRVC